MKLKALVVLTALVSTLAWAQGQTAVQITDNPSSVNLRQDILMGWRDVPVGIFQVANLADSDIVITDITVFDSSPSGASGISPMGNVRVWAGPSLLAAMNYPSGTGWSTTTAVGWTYRVHLATPRVLPAGNSITLTVRADAASYSSQGMQDNCIHQFQMLGPSAVTATTRSDYTALPVSALAYGVPVRILRNSIALTAPPAPTDQPNGPQQLVFSALDAYGGMLILNQLTVHLSGNNRNPLLPSSQVASLLDENGIDLALTGSAVKNTTNDGRVIWTFTGGPNGTGPAIDSSLSLYLRLPPGASATIGSGDIVFTDGLDPAATAGLRPASQTSISIQGSTLQP